MSQPRLEPCIPVPLDEKILNNVVDKAKDWALMHGAGMRDKKAFSPDTLNVAPFVLTPSTFPRAEFYKALEIQPILNELMHNVAHDDVFLKETLANTLEVDDFTASLYKIWETVSKEGVSQSLTLGLLRSDYLLQSSEENAIKQVEINTVASSFAGIATLVTRYHSYILQQLGHGDKIKNMPENKALSGLCEGMTDAFDLYGSPEATILFIVEDVTYNICDQRFHEFQINETRPDIKVIRKTLTEIYKEAVLDENKELIIEKHPVAVVYFRAGYEPTHYHSQGEWKARLNIERSKAIKCPSIHYHLAGTKKVQQALAVEGALERFVKDPALVQRVRDIFTGLYALDLDQRGEDAVNMAIQDSERFVLKPQREGGGNNVYGLAVRDELIRMGATRERAAFVLMERIRPPAVLGHVVRPHGQTPPPLSLLVSELGVFGVVIGSKDKIVVNRQVGHMLRTKLADADEGGVAAGLGALDSPYLVD